MSEQITVSSVDELLLADDQQFVQLAYRTVLKREPDPPGNAAYLSHLRRGVDRRRLIANMALSAEGRLKESNLPGLADLVKRYKLSPLERLGARIRRFLFGSNESVEQAVHALKIDFMRQRNEAREQMDRIERHLQTLSSEQRIGYGRLLQQMEESSAHAAASSELPEAATSGRRIVFNLSTSKHWRARPVGIVRVERELASYFAKSSNAVFVFWDAGRKAFMRLSTREVSEILSDKWTDRTRSVADVGDLSLPIALNENDTFISVGLDWDLSPLQSIAKVLIPSGCRNVFACHDLVPIKFPEFCVEEHFDQKFKQHFVNMAHLADSVFAVSSNSMRDLERFWDQAEMEAPLPEIRTVKLANLHRPDRLPRLSPVDTERLRHVRAGGSYVLYVSSIEARKNHRLLFDVWRDLYKERRENCPVLLLIGMSGWGTQDLLAQLKRMPAYLGDKVIVLDDVDDGLLLHFYETCSFAVFPSYYEGWGLAATEAMAFGKACLIADAGGLEEAVQGLMPKLHPRDFPGWKKSIEEMIDNDAYRSKLEEKVSTSFKHRTWNDFSIDFVGQLLNQETTASKASNQNIW